MDAGEALIEDVNVWINNKNPGETPAKFMGIIFGEENNPSVVFPEK